MAYDPIKDEEVYFGTEFLDAIEQPFSNLGSWISTQAEDNPDTWTDDAIRLAFGGISNVMNLPILGETLSYINQGEDWLADRARDLNQQFTPWLDPRFSGWLTRFGTGLLADKGISKILKGARGLRGLATVGDDAVKISDDLAAGLTRVIDNPRPRSVGAAGFGDNLAASSGEGNLLNRFDRIKKFKEELLQEVRRDIADTRNPYLSQTDRMALSDAMRDAGYKPGSIFRYNEFKEAVLAGARGEGRPFLQLYQTPKTIGGASRGVKFRRFREANLPKLREEFAPAIKGLGLTEAYGFQIHHIAALKASMGIWDGLQMGSPLYKQVSDRLLKHIPGLGDMTENLRPVIGSASDIGTPHYLVHRFYADKIGEAGELLFTQRVLDQMRVSRSFRLQKTDELGKIIAESEEIVTQAMQVYTDLYSTKDIPLEDIIRRMSQLDEFGYSKLIDPKYQAPNIEKIVKEIVGEIETGNLPSIVGETMSQVDFNRWFAKLKRSNRWNEMGLADKMKYLEEQTKMTYEQIDDLLSTDPNFNLDDLLNPREGKVLDEQMFDRIKKFKEKL